MSLVIRQPGKSSIIEGMGSSEFTKGDKGICVLCEKVLNSYSIMGSSAAFPCISPGCGNEICRDCYKTSNSYGSDFKCKECGNRADADYNASKNIRDLWMESTNPIPSGQAAVNQPIVLPSFSRERTSSGSCTLSS